ncbi:PREDICTED: probable 28S ribosomal protein S25, mitochondrial [Cyphomyrmex costatus]|uniref:Small ribosomal subunit protein mS25 n=1 Tax=Cyphomyrmex costatus TaxID=456900 RepID=A0A151IGA0_9HYME|nr:PREDICTED: probable 28S ribosomal protein S25, mitochondrial [Cyphomyrmex costatus]KYN00265.1 putative 28S ribosomal protein S25, mitochondrial [Cyphomyrmex costatus]
MPFMRGKEPVRRTVKYLMAGKLILKDKIQIMSFNYNTHGGHHKGTRDFVFWHLPQLQYKNPNVQIITFRNITPSPFIKCYYEDGKTMLIDADSKSKDEILDHLVRVVGKPLDIIKKETVAQEKKDNPANFGVGCDRSCICHIPGQVPCPGIVPLPNYMRGKKIVEKLLNQD